MVGCLCRLCCFRGVLVIMLWLGSGMSLKKVRASWYSSSCFVLLDCMSVSAVTFTVPLMQHNSKSRMCVGMLYLGPLCTIVVGGLLVVLALAVCLLGRGVLVPIWF